MPYGDLPSLTDDEFERMHAGSMTPDDFPEAERRDMTHAYLERLLSAYPSEWKQWFSQNAEQWFANMRSLNGRVGPYNTSGRRFKRKELKLMAQQYGFDAMGVNYAEHAKTADELLERANDAARLGKVFAAHGLV